MCKSDSLESTPGCENRTILRNWHLLINSHDSGNNSPSRDRASRLSGDNTPTGKKALVSSIVKRRLYCESPFEARLDTNYGPTIDRTRPSSIRTQVRPTCYCIEECELSDVACYISVHSHCLIFSKPSKRNIRARVVCTFSFSRVCACGLVLSEVCVGTKTD